MRIPDRDLTGFFWAVGRTVESRTVIDELVGLVLAVSEFWLRLFGVRGPSPLSQDLEHQKYNENENLVPG